MAFKSFGISFGHMRDNPSDVRILEQPASLQMNIVGARVSMVNGEPVSSYTDVETIMDSIKRDTLTLTVHPVENTKGCVFDRGLNQELIGVTLPKIIFPKIIGCAVAQNPGYKPLKEADNAKWNQMANVQICKVCDTVKIALTRPMPSKEIIQG